MPSFHVASAKILLIAWFETTVYAVVCNDTALQTIPPFFWFF